MPRLYRIALWINPIVLLNAQPLDLFMDTKSIFTLSFDCALASVKTGSAYSLVSHGLRGPEPSAVVSEDSCAVWVAGSGLALKALFSMSESPATETMLAIKVMINNAGAPTMVR